VSATDARGSNGLIGSVGLVVHHGRRPAVEAGRSLAAWLRGRGVRTRGLPGEEIGTDDVRAVDEFSDGLDLVVSVGGDGTLLRAAELAQRVDAPLLGVKVGRVGFLTEVEPAAAVPLLERALAGEMVIEERMAIVAESAGVLDAAVGSGAAAATDSAAMSPQWALNEVIVEKRARHRLVTLAASVGEEPVATFSADGVIVATPTGSTAYSFSARGPIVSPSLDCLLLTPVSPHMVFDRSLVLSPHDRVLIEVMGEEPAILSADGRTGVELPVGSAVRIGRAERPARLLRRDRETNFFGLLRDKFSLPGEAPHGPTRRDVGPGR
jgi:NAD+ kinase